MKCQFCGRIITSSKIFAIHQRACFEKSKGKIKEENTENTENTNLNTEEQYDVSNLYELSYKELKALAKKHKIEGYTKLEKNELLEALFYALSEN